MRFLNKKSAFIAALIGVIFFWRKKKKSPGEGETAETPRTPFARTLSPSRATGSGTTELKNDCRHHEGPSSGWPTTPDELVDAQEALASAAWTPWRPTGRVRVA